jgi:glutathione S-transferase
VLRDGTVVVSDSWRIACHLEDAYPHAPSLFDGAGGRQLARLVNLWFDAAIQMTVFPLLFPDLFDVVLPEDLEYFTRSRLERFGGKTRAQFAAERSPARLDAWRAQLAPLRALLAEAGPYFGGATPRYVDYVIASTFIWARAASPLPIIERTDPLYAWRERMLDAYGGAARRNPGYEY